MRNHLTGMNLGASIQNGASVPETLIGFTTPGFWGSEIWPLRTAKELGTKEFYEYHGSFDRR
jgi:hypothetical protein